ncbi:MAG: lysophospholipase [Syntrophomonadaceae bacterium]|nr:lysophospholipase [Syntrophomonadaceae bacterium]
MSTYEIKEGSFNGVDNITLHYKRWEVEPKKACIVIAHGIGEHSGRYQNLINYMHGSQVAFYALDHRGHGKSGGSRGHINSFNDYVQDLKTFIDMIHSLNPSQPVILLGHSMGGVIACHFALNYPQDIAGLILSSAGLKPMVDIPAWKSMLGKLLSKIFPAFSMPNGLDASLLSHDPQVISDYLVDPLNHDLVSARWFTEFISAGEQGLNRAGELSMPLLVIHGGQDRIVDPQGSKILYDKAASSDKTIHILEGLYHETMNELPEDRQLVIKTIADWISGHIG